MEENVSLEKIVSLAKRRGFIFPGSEIYGGLAGTWDFGPLGVALKNNIKESWRKKFVLSRSDMYEVDAAILMNSKVWEASGHIAGFTDPLIECKKCKGRSRDDEVILFNGKIGRFQTGSIDNHLADLQCPKCEEVGTLSSPRQFNMMFKTQAGAIEDSSATVYLRPETAQGMFVNFKNIIDSFHPKLPFGMAQVGKAFRNEITPRDFVFRSREFEQMEIEYFVREEDWQKQFEYWKDEMAEWMQEIGISMSLVHEIEKAPEDLAHYSKRTVDFEFDFPFGQKELFGIAYRTDFDLKQHMQHSTVPLEYSEEDGKTKFTPHVIEPTFGVERAMLALLVSAYKEDESGEESRPYLAFPPNIAPVKICVSPLLKNKPELIEKAQLVHGALKAKFGAVAWDDNGNIGKRYRRQDEIGTPYCVTVDFDTLTDDSVTVRDRDTGKQERLSIADLEKWFSEKFEK